ncbi:MAG: pilus assembly protein [Acidobacteria bacterium]|nr:pilus assembly protein [Acidobacteriota bacterium]MBI3282187.1 pilus assembly protein [Acidobacteriota bacterium]
MRSASHSQAARPFPSGRPDPANGEHGQATVEWAIVFTGLIVPITFAIIFTGQLLWLWHSMVDFTRDGARYAATHCWQGAGENVVNYMRTHVPPTIDMDQFQGGQVDIAVEYFARDPETGTLSEFSCDGSECSTECIPDTVTVRIRNYEFSRFMAYLGLPPIVMPEFQTSLPIEGAGCDPEGAACNP